MPTKAKDCCESSSSISSSEVCCKVKCEPKCIKPCCKVSKCPCYSPEEIYCKYKDAVVELHSEFILLGSTGTTAGTEGNIPFTSATGGTPLAPNSRMDYILEGNGFFIKGHYIIAPAQLVLLPPSLTSVVNRYPLAEGSTTLGTIKNQMIQASRILVSVFNVNGKGCSYVYEAELVGVDGAGDIAVLKINYNKQWNACNPCVEKCHPYLTFAKSRGCIGGEKVYMLGDFAGNDFEGNTFNAVGGIVDGLLADHRYLEYSGWVLPECVLVSAPAYSFSAGLPILNCRGQVVGMQTTDLYASNPLLHPQIQQQSGVGFVSGPSEYFMRKVIASIIRGTCSRRYNCQLETICDPVGSYYRYKKGYAGIAYEVFTGKDYDITSDFTSGAAYANVPRIRLSPTGDFLSYPACKDLVGIKVLGLAGINPTDATDILNGYFYVPGGTGTASLNSDLLVSPFLGKLLPGDVITHINGIALGDLNQQIAPSLITWRLCANDQIEVRYRRGGNSLNSGDNTFTENYENQYTARCCLNEFPALMDYPWYAVNIFPSLSAEPTPAFIFPIGQLLEPQLPALDNDAASVFHPAF